MQHIIGKFYKTEEALLEAVEKEIRNCEFYSFEAENGYFLISERQAEKFLPKKEQSKLL